MNFRVDVYHHLADLCEPGEEITLIPGIGIASEHTGPVTPTPQYQGRPPIGARQLMAFELTATQQVTLTVAPKDRRGNPAQVQDPTWQVDNPNLVSLVPAPDGLSCVVAALGPIGAGTLTFRCDSNLGAGVVELIGTVQFTITPGTATVIEITPGTPTESP
jgi:hypothetical protein